MKKLNVLKSTLRTIFISILITVISFVTCFSLLMIFGESYTNIIITIPLISGFLHVNFDHFLCNFIGLYLLLLPPINNKYNYLDIYFITLMLSLLYLPFVVSGGLPPAVGISGTCFFLMSRFLISMKPFRLGICLLVALITLELYGYEPSDHIAHLVHFLGIITGCFSLKKNTIIGISVIHSEKTVKYRFADIILFLKTTTKNILNRVYPNSVALE